MDLFTELGNILRPEITVEPVLCTGFYRCGYCGQPTDKDGRPLDYEEYKLFTEDNLSDAEAVHGYCCPPEQW